MANQVILGRHVAYALVAEVGRRYAVGKVAPERFIINTSPDGGHSANRITYEFPHFSTQELTRSLEQFFELYLDEPATWLARVIIQRREFGQVTRMYHLQPPHGCDWAESICDPNTGISLLLCRVYNAIHNMMFTTVTIAYD